MKAKNNKMKRDKQSLAFYAMIIGSALLIAALFLPFATATEEYAEHLNRYPKRYLVEEIEMENADGIQISLMKFLRIYYAAAKLEISREVGIACMVILFIFALFAIMTAIFSVCRKPILTILFDILSFAMINLVRWDFQERGVIPSRRYDWGIAAYAVYIGVMIVIAGAVVFLTEKRKQKREQ